MVPTLRVTTTDTRTDLGRHWGWVLAHGSITVLAGLAALVWPAPTIVVLAVVFGVQFIVVGVYRFIAASSPPPRPRHRHNRVPVPSLPAPPGQVMIDRLSLDSYRVSLLAAGNKGEISGLPDNLQVIEEPGRRPKPIPAVDSTHEHHLGHASVVRTCHRRPQQHPIAGECQDRG